MRYLGGKSRTAKQIVAYLESVRLGLPFVEPFCGGLWITQEMSGTRLCSDGNRALISLYRAMQKGWAPPETVTEETYRQYKTTQDPEDPMTAFVGIGCSFGGKWFGGYARDPKSNRNYASSTRNSLLKKLARCVDVKFSSADYRDVLNGLKSRSLIYLDPPYANVTGYAATEPFDTEAFWDVVRTLSCNHLIYVSEYSAPEDFQCVLEMPTKTNLGGANKLPRIEKLFHYQGHAHAQV